MTSSLSGREIRAKLLEMAEPKPVPVTPVKTSESVSRRPDHETVASYFSLRFGK